jgi:hypothetical protein
MQWNKFEGKIKRLKFMEPMSTNPSLIGKKAKIVVSHFVCWVYNNFVISFIVTGKVEV